MGSHYYPDGNSLLDKDPADDPDRRAKPEILPGRGYQPIGYAAVSTAGLAHDGELKEEHLAEVVRRHLDDLSAVARRAGLPREQIFTHCGGWAEGERLYRSAVNENSCPGWSFYRHGRDPRGDKTAMAAVAASTLRSGRQPSGCRSAHGRRRTGRRRFAIRLRPIDVAMCAFTTGGKLRKTWLPRRAFDGRCRKHCRQIAGLSPNHRPQKLSGD